MTAKNRQKNSEKGAASGQQDDAPKKNQPSASVSAAVHHGGSSSSRSGSCLGLLATTVFYAALMGAAGFAAFHVQHVVEEMRESNAKQEESARHYSDIATKMVTVVQQVGLRENAWIIGERCGWCKHRVPPVFVWCPSRKVTIVSDDFGYNYITVHTSCCVHDGGGVRSDGPCKKVPN